MSNRKNAAIWLLKIALAFSLLYAAVSSFLNPIAWIGFFPIWMLDLVPESMLTVGFSAVEIILAFLLLSMKRPLYPALVTALLLIGIVVFNMGAIDIVFRDVSLALTAIALILITHKKNDSINASINTVIQ